MKNLTRLADPFGVIEKLMESDFDQASWAAHYGGTQSPQFDISSVVDLLRIVHQKRQGGAPTTIDSLSSSPSDLLDDSGTGGLVDDSRLKAQSGEPDNSKWPTVQQELRLWCLGDSTGGKFVVINEKDTPDVFTFECVRPLGVSAESWSGIDISLDTNLLELAPGKHGIVRLRIALNEFNPNTAKFEFCVDIRGGSGGLVSKLWVVVTFPNRTGR